MLNEDLASAYEALDNLKKHPDSISAIDPLLRFVEQNPSLDFWNPGPITHFLETFYKKGYEEELLESLSRKPTYHTVWMLNRIINWSADDERSKYVHVLRQIREKEGLDPDVIDLLNNLL